MNHTTVWQSNTVRVFIYNIPTTFLPIVGNAAFVYVLKYTLMKITNVIVVRLVSLTEYLVTNDFFPRSAIYSFLRRCPETVTVIL